MDDIILSSLKHTWILDLDGTILVHNGYKIFGEDVLLPGAKEFMDSIPVDDFILFLTSRELLYKDETEKFLRENGIRFNRIIFNIPFGERILINDDKPSGLCMAYSYRHERNKRFDYRLRIDYTL